MLALTAAVAPAASILASILASTLGTPTFWGGVATGVLVTLVAVIAGRVVTRRRRRHAPPADASAPPQHVPARPVRRPLLLDRPLLNDLLAHAEPRDFGRELRTTLADDDLRGDAGDTRLLNKVMAGLRRHRHLIDLDHDPEAPLAAGRAVLVTGQLAARAVTLRAGSGEGYAGADHGGALRTHLRPALVVLELHDERSGRHYVGVVDRRQLRLDGLEHLDAPLSVLAVVDEVLSSQQQAAASRILHGHLADEVDLAAVPPVPGPGAVVSIAALFR